MALELNHKSCIRVRNDRVGSLNSTTGAGLADTVASAARPSAARQAPAQGGKRVPLANSAVQGALSAGVKVGSGKGELVVVGGNCLAPESRTSSKAPCTLPSTGRRSTWVAIRQTP